MIQGNPQAEDNKKSYITMAGAAKVHAAYASLKGEPSRNM
jgi:hypothetical protein